MKNENTFELSHLSIRKEKRARGGVDSESNPTDSGHKFLVWSIRCSDDVKQQVPHPVKSQSTTTEWMFAF